MTHLREAMTKGDSDGDGHEAGNHNGEGDALGTRQEEGTWLYPSGD